MPRPRERSPPGWGGGSSVGLRLQLLEVEELGLGRRVHPIRAARHPVVVDEVPEHEVGRSVVDAVARGGVGEGEQDPVPRVLARLEDGLGAAAELLHPRPAAPVAGAEPIDEAPEPRPHVRGQRAQRAVERRVDQHVEAGGRGHGGARTGGPHRASGVPDSSVPVIPPGIVELVVKLLR